jgi:hypothetical protein
MTPAELKAYAEKLILEHSQEVGFLSIVEMAEDHAPGGKITEDEARQVDELIAQATITVSWDPES